MIAGIEESKSKYDLVVVGIAREWSAHEDTILQTSDLLLSSPVSFYFILVLFLFCIIITIICTLNYFDDRRRQCC